MTFCYVWTEQVSSSSKGFLTCTQVPGSNLGWGIVLSKNFIVFSEYLKADFNVVS